MSEQLEKQLAAVTAKVDQADAALNKERKKKAGYEAKLQESKAVIRDLSKVRDGHRLEQMSIQRALDPGQTIGGE